MRLLPDIRQRAAGLFRRGLRKNQIECCRGIPPAHRFRSIPMMDVVMVALAVSFFALSIVYVYACEQL
jgi:hypothetical protein